MKIHSIREEVMKINPVNLTAHSAFKGAYVIRGTNEEVNEFNECFYENMKSKGHRGKFRLYYYGPRISPDQPQCDLFVATDKDRDTLSDFLLEERKAEKRDLKEREHPPEDVKSREFDYWYFKETDKTLRNLRRKFGSPIHIISAASALRAIEKDTFNFTTGEIER